MSNDEKGTTGYDIFIPYQRKPLGQALSWGKLTKPIPLDSTGLVMARDEH